MTPRAWPVELADAIPPDEGLHHRVLDQVLRPVTIARQISGNSFLFFRTIAFDIKVGPVNFVIYDRMSVRQKSSQ